MPKIPYAILVDKEVGYTETEIRRAVVTFASDAVPDFLFFQQAEAKFFKIVVDCIEDTAFFVCFFHCMFTLTVEILPDEECYG